MVSSLALSFAAIAGGTIATYGYEDDAPVAWRVAAGAVSGIALLGLVALALALGWGLNGRTLILTGCFSSLPLLLLGSQNIRARVRADVHRVPQLLRPASAGQWVRFLLLVLVALASWRLLDRVLVELPEGLYTGFSNNYGDLPFHAGVITRFAFGDNFPPEHPSFAGAAFVYPYIADLVTAAFVRAGATMRQAMLLQNAVLLASLLVLLTAWFQQLTRDRSAAQLACLLVFLSGGCGWWMLVLEMSRTTEPAKLLLTLPHDYTVINGSSWRWGNLLTALLIPQRSLLLGLPLAVMVFTLLTRIWDALAGEDSKTGRRVVAAGLLTGLLPLIHAHTYVVVFGVAACQALWFWRKWRVWWPFFALSAMLGVPQALWLMASGSVDTARFLGWHVGWDHGTSNVVSFWLRNTGAFIPLLLLALFWRDARSPVPPRLVRLYLPFTLWFIIPNLLRLAPWVWDNIKILVYWHIASAPLVALVLVHWWRRSVPARVGSVLLAVSLVLAGGLDLWRVMSKAKSFELFTSEGIEFARFIRDVVPPQATIVHGPTHNHPVFLSGRRSLMGYPGHVWSHGLPHAAREADIRNIYKGGPDALRLLDKYQIDYLVVGPFERRQLSVNEPFFSRYPKIGAIGAYDLYQTARQGANESRVGRQ
jgi:hypothetical protein